MAEKIGIIGLGRMGRCLVQGLLESGSVHKADLLFSTRQEEAGRQIEKELGISRARDNRDLVQKCQTVVVAVKPQQLGEVLDEIGDKFPAGTTLISIVASVPTSRIEEHLAKGTPVLRAMPNTPAFVRAGITAICLGRHAKERDWERASTIFRPLGRTLRVEERYMDAVTGLSGCGPAYIYMVMESLTDGGIKVGLPREVATELAAQTVLGSAKMLLETGRHPAALKDEVTTPAGCTIDGLMELEEGKLRVTLIKAVVQATKRARSLAKASKV